MVLIVAAERQRTAVTRVIRRRGAVGYRSTLTDACRGVGGSPGVSCLVVVDEEASVCAEKEREAGEVGA
jgi:hypothetical protein